MKSKETSVTDCFGLMQDERCSAGPWLQAGFMQASQGALLTTTPSALPLLLRLIRSNSCWTVCMRREEKVLQHLNEDCATRFPLCDLILEPQASVICRNSQHTRFLLLSFSEQFCFTSSLQAQVCCWCLYLSLSSGPLLEEVRRKEQTPPVQQMKLFQSFTKRWILRRWQKQ